MSAGRWRKHPAESRPYGFDFAADLAVGETLVSATFAIEVVKGADAAAADMLSGSAGVSGSQALQRIVDGVAGTTYRVTATVETSAGNTLEGCGLLDVVD